MSNTVLTNARLFSGVDGEVIEGASLWWEDGVIRFVGPSGDLSGVPDGAWRIDLGGKFLMPGMTESHAHISYTNNGPTELDKTPVEEAMLHSVANARLMLGAGFTSAISFGSVHRIDVHLKQGIEQGHIPGPRLVASGRDVGATSSNADLHPDHARPQMEGLGMLVDGPWAVRRAVRILKKNGADIIKIFLDGEGLSDHAPPGELTYTDEEVDAAVSEAHRRNMRVACHARSAAAVKQAVRFGVDVIGHANYLDGEAVDLLRRHRHRLAVGPAIAWEIEFLNHHDSLGFSRQAVLDKGYEREVEATVDAVKRLRAAGVRVLPGGDYGLNITPHGTYAKDLQYFVERFGMTSTEALLCATRDGGAVADPNGMVGTLEAGKHADIVVVDGDPVADIRILQDSARIAAVIKGGRIYQGLMDNNPYERQGAEALALAIGQANGAGGERAAGH